MFDAERQAMILEILNEKNTIGVNDLAKMVYCSGSTVRRDLDRLEKKGLVIRTFGAVTLNTVSSNNETAFEVREKTSISDKRELTKKAASLIRPNSTVFIDSSSTLFYIIPFLKDIKNLLIITNGLRIANEILNQTKHTVIMLGGTLQPNTNSVLGALAIDQINNLHADLALFSCYGITPEFGTSEASADSAILKRIMVEHSDVSLCVFDCAKLNTTGTFKSIALDDIDFIVTNGEIDEVQMKSFKNHGIVMI